MTTTNAMRLLKQADSEFETASYEVDESDLSGVHAAAAMGLDPARVFKTLVTRGEKHGVCVFCIPVACELDLKKCAAAAGEKKVEMIHVRELQPLTGYIRGGCSPVGMKKKYPTVIDETARQFDRIYVSAGQRGLQMCVDPIALGNYTGAKFTPVTKDR